MSLILNIQHWNGDKEQAMQLARLIADLEDNPRSDVVLLFTHRFDTDLDWATVEYVHKKFPRTYTHKTTRYGVGWPEGPNAMYADSHMHCVERTRDGSWPNVDGIFFMEADSVPLTKDWLNKIIDEWESTKKEGKSVLGCWLEAGDCGIKHINGNCIIHKDLWRRERALFHPRSGGWDADLASSMLPHGRPSRYIYSDYGLGKEGYNDWKGCDDMWKTRRYRASNHPLAGEDINPSYLHGPKKIESIDCVRKRLLDNKP